MIQRLRQHKSLQGSLLASPALLWMIVLLIVPLLLIVIISFGGRDADGNVIYTFRLDNYIRLTGYTDNCRSAGDYFSGLWQAITNPAAYDETTNPATRCFDPLYLQILWRSVSLALQTTLVVILMGYPLAYYVARSSIRRRNLLLFLILVPLWTNFVIRVYAWIIILRGQGVLNGLLGSGASALGLPFRPLDLYPSAGAVLVGMVYEFLPFMILPMYTSLEKIDTSLYEAAADLGANPLRTFLRVTLPLSMPGVVAGTILVFVPVMGTFVVSDILGGKQFVLVGNLIQRQFLDARDRAFGSAASIILMVMTLLVTVYYTRRFGFGEEIAPV
ncbi:MAG TPA: ABC transporter permease [Anaerolineae bacterium]